MHIGIFTDTYSPQINGVVTSILSFAKELKRLGHQVFIFAPAVKEDNRKEDDVYRWKSYPFPFYREHRFVIPHFQAIAKKAKGIQLDLIHTQTPFTLGVAGTLLAKEMNIPLVHTYHTYVTQYGQDLPIIPPTISTWIAKKLSCIYCNLCDLIFTPSEEMRKVLFSYGITRQIQVLPTGINPEDFKPQDPGAILKKFRIPPSSKLLLFVGRVGKEKNIDFLLESFQLITKAFPSVYLLISGGGPKKEEMIKLSESLGLSSQVRFSGHLPRQELIDSYAAADLFVFTSLTETQGLVLLEAMTLGTPVVAVRAMGVKEVLQDSRGGFLTELSKEAFSQKVLELLKDDQLRAKKSKEARERAEEMSASRLALELEKHYLSLTKIFPNV